tara:strand:- start:482 stop:754 length:273 start_codon:yes stop_codon:yes gene_type:complete
MKELDENIGKIYHKDDYYYLEKVYEDLGGLMDDEPVIKKRAKKYGFKVINTSWHLEPNPHYYVQTIMNDFNTEGLSELRYIFKVKLEYTK